MKKNLKMILILLVVILCGYIHLMGGLKRAVIEVADGRLLNFERQEDPNNLLVGLILIKHNETNGPRKCYKGNLSKEEWIKISIMDNDISVTDFNDMIIKYKFEKVISDFDLKGCSKQKLFYSLE